MQRKSPFKTVHVPSEGKLHSWNPSLAFQLYRYHKARNCAVCTVNGRNHDLGEWQSAESLEKYARLIVLPQLKMEFVSGRLDKSLTGDSTHKFQHRISIETEGKMAEWLRVFLPIAAILLLLWLGVRLLRLSLQGVSAVLRGLNELLWFVLRIPLLPFRLMLGIIRLFTKRSFSQTTLRKKRPRGELRGAPSIHWPPKGQFDFEVVGESFYQEAIQRQFVVQNELVKGGGTLVAELIPEDDNPYDGNAIAVFINDDLVGYMSRNDAKSFRIRLSKHGISKKISTCNAVIQEHERSSINDGGCMYSVWLDLQLFRR